MHLELDPKRLCSTVSETGGYSGGWDLEAGWWAGQLATLLVFVQRYRSNCRDSDAV